ncbi:hypothetical protein Q3G72_023504 [Acer saccharum]|nr:hypothetical protein Q3G72_023504 [Acer saccharum]
MLAVERKESRPNYIQAVEAVEHIRGSEPFPPPDQNKRIVCSGSLTTGNGKIVDEWVRLNPPTGHETSALMVDGDSPQQKIPQNGHHQVPDFAYSPNPQNGNSGSDKNNSKPKRKAKIGYSWKERNSN